MGGGGGGALYRPSYRFFVFLATVSSAVNDLRRERCLRRNDFLITRKENNRYCELTVYLHAKHIFTIPTAYAFAFARSTVGHS